MQENIKNPFPYQKDDQEIALRAAYPAGLPWLLYDYFLERQDLLKASIKNKNFRFMSKKDQASYRHGRHIFIFVIGESSRSDHWSINGYDRDTNPYLGKRKDIISFRRMRTFWTYTRLAVPAMLTRKPPTSDDANFSEGSILKAFSEAGFHTAWISLQAPLGFHDSPVTLYASDADETFFLNPVDYRFHGKNDAEALPQLRKVVESHKDQDLFIIIHTLGSHFRYTDRYPAGFSKFLPDNPAARPAQLFNMGDRQVLTNAYDNSIRYTDYFLDSLVTYLQGFGDTQSWLLYSSDHGEALFDNCKNLSGHGEKLLSTQSPASIFWASPSYIKDHPEKYRLMREHGDSLASTAMMFETMSDLGDLYVPGNRPHNSLAGPALRLPQEILESERDRQCPGEVPAANVGVTH